MNSWEFAVLSGILVFSLAGCAPKKQALKPSAPVEETTEARVLNEDVRSEELDIHHKKDFQESNDLQAVHFDYDKAALSDESQQILSTNADYLKQNPEMQVLVEGHCDQRGTVGYNLALGQERASAVRKYYMSLGIDGRRIGTISYGKEMALCYEDSESCWLQNRRGETKVRAPRVAESEPGPVPHP